MHGLPIADNYFNRVNIFDILTAWFLTSARNRAAIINHRDFLAELDLA
mgnify:CR=1 FL=1